jgi:outer membrane protein OmpA-like peptidoglycan-associated protein
MRKLLLLIITTFTLINGAQAQKILLDGYVYEKYNRGFLNEVKIAILDESEVLIGETMSDIDGHFSMEVPAGKDYFIDYSKKVFANKREKVSARGISVGERVLVKLEMERQPGYLLEVTLAEKRSSEDISVDAVNGSRIEIYNNTLKKEELVIDSSKSPVFSITLKQGNEYSILVRKKGFYNKRLHANVNINGCYLCMDGFGTVNPGVVSNLTSAEDNMLGTLIANVELDKIDLNKSIVIKNIYYDYNSAVISEQSKKELDKVVGLLKTNPGLIVELGSHTDARGTDDYNLTLSQARAQSAVDYITSSNSVSREKLKAKGYGETQLTNNCKNGIPCTDDQHLQNRRTELKVVGFTTDTYDGRSLLEIMHEEEIQQFVNSGESAKEYSTTPSVKTPSASPKAAKSVITKTKIVSKEPVPKVSKVDDTPINTYVETFDDKESIIKTTPKALKVEPKINKKHPPSDDKAGSVQETKPSTAEAIKDKKPIEVGSVLLMSVTDYSGYKIEIFNTKTALAANDPDLKMIAYDMAAQGVSTDIFSETLKSGDTSYLIGYFQGWAETENFLSKISKKYPYARIIEYFKGKRLGQ